MYFTFDNDQWVSFDNKDTFQQKVDWANGVGLGGAMIWASDLGMYLFCLPHHGSSVCQASPNTHLDDDKFSAHTALLGREIKSTKTLQTVDKAKSNPQAVISSLASDNGQSCFAYKGKCKNLDKPEELQDACGAGYTVVGWDDASCGKKNHVSSNLDEATVEHYIEFCLLALRKADLLSNERSA